MIKVGFTLIGRMGWAGGANYLRNMLSVMQSHLGGQVQAQLFLSPHEAQENYELFAPLLVEPPVVDPLFENAGRGKSLQKAMLSGRDKGLEAFLKGHKIDLMFENAVFYGWRFGVPVLSWMPDFQHHHMPEMFSRKGWWQREIGFRMQTKWQRTVMLSSQTARADCERFYPSTKGRTAVVPFAINLDPADHLGCKAELTSTYDLPPRFIYLPNQFWKHKNHALVIRALAQLASQGNIDEVLPVIASGPQKDPRHPALFDDLMKSVKAQGLDKHFRYLGLIPYMDVLGLAASADYLINPSLFEGWSTPIEEAKALGAPLLLSDIDIHKEQSPDALFFDPQSVDALAASLLDIARKPTPKRPSCQSLTEQQNQRLQKYAKDLLVAIKQGKG